MHSTDVNHLQIIYGKLPYLNVHVTWLISSPNFGLQDAHQRSTSNVSYVPADNLLNTTGLERNKSLLGVFLERFHQFFDSEPYD
jgi:hypothetical protein